MNKISVGEFKTVYKKERNKETSAMVESDYSWQQSVNIPFTEFPDMKNEKINNDVSVVVSGKISSIDEKHVTVKIDSMALCNKEYTKEEKKEVNKSDVIKEKSSKDAGKFGKIFKD